MLPYATGFTALLKFTRHMLRAIPSVLSSTFLWQYNPIIALSEGNFHPSSYNGMGICTAVEYSYIPSLAVSANHTCLSEHDLDFMAEVIVAAYDRGILIANDTDHGQRWDFSTAVFFSMTVNTTIGQRQQSM